MKPVITVICLTTSDCNLDCDYCYVKASYENHLKLPADLIPTFIKNCSIGFDSVEFCWHGGESLLMGKEFFETVISAEKKINEDRNGKITFRNIVQSNCLLMTEELLEFFKLNNFGIGSTFEAPPEIHMRHRHPCSNGQICEEDYLRIFRRIKSLGFPLGLLCVVTKDNVNRAREIFNFFGEIGADTYSLLPLIKVASDRIPEQPSNDELFELYKETFELWINEENNFNCIEPIDTMMRGLLGDIPRLCTFASSCLNKMITISPTGDVIPCGSLNKICLGNIFERPLISILVSERTKKLKEKRQISINRYCVSKKCEYIPLCRGGCREVAYWNSGQYDGEYYYCKSRIKTFNYLKKRLDEIINTQ